MPTRLDFIGLFFFFTFAGNRKDVKNKHFTQIIPAPAHKKIKFFTPCKY
jgi:hypothetical protein